MKKLLLVALLLLLAINVSFAKRTVLKDAVNIDFSAYARTFADIAALHPDWRDQVVGYAAQGEVEYHKALACFDKDNNTAHGIFGLFKPHCVSLYGMQGDLLDFSSEGKKNSHSIAWLITDYLPGLFINAFYAILFTAAVYISFLFFFAGLTGDQYEAKEKINALFRGWLIVVFSVYIINTAIRIIKFFNRDTADAIISDPYEFVYGLLPSVQTLLAVFALLVLVINAIRFIY